MVTINIITDHPSTHPLIPFRDTMVGKSKNVYDNDDFETKYVLSLSLIHISEPTRPY